MSMTVESPEEKLIFLVSAPRSGSTLLMRILNATDTISARSEPHLLPPLAHLGYWRRVDKAPYDQIQAQNAIRALIDAPEFGTELYIKACRSYTDILYGSMLRNGGREYFLDKTPANALVLPFLRQLYPRARFVVLTRHPAAIFASYARSFFDGDAQAASRFNPILARYIPAIARFLANPPHYCHHVHYEDLVRDPDGALKDLSTFLDIPYQPQALNYQQKSVDKGLGDPLGVQQHQRPVQDSILRWTSFFISQPNNKKLLEKQLLGVSNQELAYFGCSIQSIWKDLVDAKKEASPKKKQWNRFLLERKLLLLLRKDIEKRPHGRLIKQIRHICDVLLRGS